jgi:RNA polymerase sigma factor (sigma-70 family)
MPFQFEASQPEDEHESVCRARDGDSQALDELLAHHLPALQAYVCSQMPAALRAYESVSDVVQSVCGEVLRHEQFEYKGPAAFRCWLYRAVTFRILSKLRKLNADCRSPEHEATTIDVEQLTGSEKQPGPASILSQREDVARLEAALAQMKPEEAEILAMRYFAGAHAQDIAGELNISKDAADKRLSRARERLKELFAKLK